MDFVDERVVSIGVGGDLRCGLWSGGCGTLANECLGLLSSR